MPMHRLLTLGADGAFLDHVRGGQEDPGPPIRLFDVVARGWVGFFA